MKESKNRGIFELHQLLESFPDIKRFIQTFIPHQVVEQAGQKPKSPDSVYSASGMRMEIWGTHHHVQETQRVPCSLSQSRTLFLHPY